MARDGIEGAKKKAGAGGGDEVMWILMPPEAIPGYVKAKLPPGVSWVGPMVYAKADDGTVVSVIAGGTPTAPPRPDKEAAVRRALAAYLTDRAGAAEKARHGHELAVAAAEAEKQRLRLEDIIQRLAEGGPDAVTLDELRDLTVHQHGSERLAELQAAARTGAADDSSPVAIPIGDSPVAASRQGVAGSQ